MIAYIAIPLSLLAVIGAASPLGERASPDVEVARSEGANFIDFYRGNQKREATEGANFIDFYKGGQKREATEDANFIDFYHGNQKREATEGANFIDFYMKMPTSLTSIRVATAVNSSPTQKGSFEDQRASITRYISKVDSLEDLSGKHDAAWSSMLNTPQGGFLWVKYNETNNMAWGVTMFHSIHCLTLLRSMLQMQLQNATSSQKAHANPTHQSSNHHAFDEGHVGHCFSYIAQQVMCAADDTIEPPWIKKASDDVIIDAGVSGEGFRHQCRDASLVWETVMQSEHKPIEPWNWAMGDTVQSIFGKK